MASCITSQWVSTAPQTKLTVTQQSSDGDSVVLEWVLQYVASSAASTNGTGRAYTVKIGGETVKTGTYNINGKSGTNTIASGTKTIAKGTSAKSVAFSVSFAFNLTWSGTYKGTLTASGSISVAAKTSYAIKYNANGGSGVPSQQTKWYGTAVTLSSTKPIRSGYTFKNWNTASGGGGTSYVSGASYTANAAATLYAQWTANTYTVAFNANGGTGAPSQQTKTYGVNLTLSSTKPTRTGYNFKGWATTATATTAAYQSGGTYTSNQAITLYAVWEIAYVKPKITGVVVKWSGKFALISFEWQTFQNVSAITVEWEDASGTIASKNINASGKIGTASTVTPALDIEATYIIRITVTDAGGSDTVSRILSSTVYPLGVLPENKGISFGKTPELEGYADFGYKTRHRKPIEFENNNAIFGIKPDGTVVEAVNPQDSNGNVVFGYGNYSNKSGNAYIYGHDVYVGVSDLATSTIYKPYLSRGDTLEIDLIPTSGYVTNGGKEVWFFVPTSCPIIGSPTVTVTSNEGFILRQNGKYTHGSAFDATNGFTYAFPTNYSVKKTVYSQGIYLVAIFSANTNAVNNAPIGIYWGGTITFS